MMYLDISFNLAVFSIILLYSVIVLTGYFNSLSVLFYLKECFMKKLSCLEEWSDLDTFFVEERNITYRIEYLYTPLK